MTQTRGEGSSLPAYFMLGIAVMGLALLWANSGDPAFDRLARIAEGQDANNTDHLNWLNKNFPEK